MGKRWGIALVGTCDLASCLFKITCCSCNEGDHSRHVCPFLLIHGSTCSPYLSFAKNAAKLWKVQPKKGEELKLFTLNGALIVDERIDVGELSKSWTIGTYLSILVKKSPSQIKIGVGTIKETESSYTSTSSQVTAALTFILTFCKYRFLNTSIFF